MVCAHGLSDEDLVLTSCKWREDGSLLISLRMHLLARFDCFVVADYRRSRREAFFVPVLLRVYLSNVMCKSRVIFR